METQSRRDAKAQSEADGVRAEAREWARRVARGERVIMVFPNAPHPSPLPKGEREQEVDCDSV